MKTTRLMLILTLVFYCGIACCGQSNWPTWRGPAGDGTSMATGLPLTWSETSNIVWKIPIHDLGYSTPVIWGGRIWLTTAKRNGTTLYAVCVDFKTGKIIYDLALFHPVEPQKINSMNSYATPSPVLEKARVYVHYGTLGTACINSETGRVVWRRTDLNCNHMQGPVSSPVLFKNFLIVSLEGIDVQFTAGLDKKTGKTLWRYDRPRELYKDLEPFFFRKAYHTPIIAYINGRPQLVSNGSQLATGHNPETGREIWRVVYGGDNTISSCVSGNGLFFINTGGTGRNVRLWAVRHGGKGDITKSHVTWKVKEDVPVESSPVLAGDLLYMVSDRGKLTCMEAETGRKVWFEQLEDRYGASPLFADNRIYISSKKGLTTVIKPGRKFIKLAANKLDGEHLASAAVSDRSLVFRTKKFLYRIEESKKKYLPGGREIKEGGDI